MCSLLHNSQYQPLSLANNNFMNRCCRKSLLLCLRLHKWQKWDVSMISRYQSASLCITSPLLVFIPWPFHFYYCPTGGGRDTGLKADLWSTFALTTGGVWHVHGEFPSPYAPPSFPPRPHVTRVSLTCRDAPGESVFTFQKRREKHVLHGEMCPPGGPHLAALGLRLHDLQHTALLSWWETNERQWWHFPAGLAHGGANRRGSLCKYKPIIRVQIQKSEVLLSKLVSPSSVFALICWLLLHEFLFNPFQQCRCCARAAPLSGLGARVAAGTVAAETAAGWVKTP